MGQSLVNNYVHIIFSTKNRIPYIDASIEDKLFRYLGGICNSYECEPIVIGGHLNHVHILCKLSKKMTLVKLLKELKSSSSKWIKTSNIRKFEDFSWQKGYGAFSINPREVEIVIQYINNQHKHHATKSFQEEYLAFLNQYKVKYDLKYLWQ